MKYLPTAMGSLFKSVNKAYKETIKSIFYFLIYFYLLDSGAHTRKSPAEKIFDTYAKNINLNATTMSKEEALLILSL